MEKVCLKVVIAKAFNIVDWFSLVGKGFEEKFMNWIKNCISAKSFFMPVNGSPTKVCCLTRGLK